MKKLVLLIAIFATQFIFAQIQDAWVFFEDKEDVEASLNNPLSILTQAAIDRKALHNVAIDERDVPVNENYIAELKAAPGISVLAKSKWLNCVYVQGAQGAIEDLLSLSSVNAIEWADKDLNFPAPNPNRSINKFELENQSSRVEYDYGAAANQIEMISGDFLHQQDFTGEGMVIAVLDSGFPNVETIPGFSHIVNDGRLLGTYDFFSRTTDATGTGSHGTRTFSDIGGFIENEFVGTAPGASFYLFRTEYAQDENPREEAWWVEALERADSLGVDVINTSLGYQAYDDPDYDHTYADLDGQTTFSARGANVAFDKGMLLVTSAGNSGNIFGTVGTPADAPGVFTVGAVTADEVYTSSSSKGPTVDGRIKPDGMAQGVGAAVITQDGDVSSNNGTSFSSPIMAGAIACLWQSRPEVPNRHIMRIVRESSHLYDNPTDEMGYGIPNFEDAYNALQLLGVEDELRQQNFAIFPNPSEGMINVSFPEAVERATVSMFSVLGNNVGEYIISLNENSFDISGLSNGMYIAVVKANGATNAFKIVKK